MAKEKAGTNTRAGSLVGANGQAQGKRRTRSVRVLCAYCGRSYLLSRRVAPATAVDWMSGGRLTGSRSAAGRSGRLEVA